MASHLKLPVELPPCGIFVGTGIMNSKAGYLVGTGLIHTTWVPQLFTPMELLDKIIEDNQGNTVQYWGFSGGLGPVTFARHHALEDLGMTPPEPDWENGRNLVISDWVNREDFRERSGAGVLKLVRAAAQKGLYIQLLYTESDPQWVAQFLGAGGKHYLGYDFGERFTISIDEAHLKGGNLESVTLQTLADSLMQRVSDHVEERHAQGWGNVTATSGNFYLDYEIAAGADIPMTEDFAFRHLNLSSALSRGLYRKHSLPLWGSHLAHEHYSWIPYASELKFPLLRAAMYHKYLAGSKVVLNESGGWYLEAALVTDSPLFETKRVPGRHNQRDPRVGAPYVAEASKDFGKINYHSPTARAYRREISDFYDFVKAHGTPEGQPETTLAVIKGNLDLGGPGFSPNGAIGGMFTVAERDPRWFSGAPERGWDIIQKVFYPCPPVLAPWQNHFLSGTPYGQVDLTSFANDDVDADFLAANYKALLFAGWNTASEKQYAALCRYVSAGGTLFVSIPHLSTDVRRNFAAFEKQDLVHGGDFSELCGLVVKGRGPRIYWATTPEKQCELGFPFARRFGILAVCLGDIEITDPAVETLATDDEDFSPVVLRRKLGKGSVYFLNTWAYPGATDADFGPGAEIGSPGLAGYVYRHIARQNRGTVWISDDGNDAGPECRHISYSYFPADGRICLQNIDLRNPRSFVLHQSGAQERLELAPGEFRFHAGSRQS
ncbi:MAG TPA: hypothetical protein PLS03_09255 [Terrimicrobiaceae bacterium]|nr:hypothetical protein [Terrimicrobiaceae bacterium]